MKQNSAVQIKIWERIINKEIITCSRTQFMLNLKKNKIFGVSQVY